MKIVIVLCLLLPVAVVECGLAGGVNKIQAPPLNDAKIVFAINAINAMYKSKNDLKTRTGVKVISATSQVVAGAVYRYEIEITGGSLNEICEVAVWSRPWLSDADKMKISGNITCKQVVPEPPAAVPGGINKAPSSDLDVLKSFGFLIKDINSKMNSLNRVKGVSTGQVFKQIVNGVNYFFTNFKIQLVTGSSPVSVCNATVYWNPRASPKYKVSGFICRKPAPAPEVPEAVEEVDAVPGGLTKLASNDTTLHKVFGFLVKALNKKMRYMHGNMLVKGVSPGDVYKQIVNGVNYYFTNFKIQRIRGTHAVSVCNATVYWNPRDSPLYNVSSFSCSSSTPAPADPIPGGQTVVPFTDSDVQDALKAVTRRVNSGSNSLQYLSASTAAKVTRQVVNGVMYRFYSVNYHFTSCSKADVAAYPNKVCTITKPNDPPQTVCTSSVLYSPSSTPNYVLKSHHCS